MSELSRRQVLAATAAAFSALALPDAAAFARSNIITNFNRGRPRAWTVTKIVTEEDGIWPMVSASSPRLMEEAIARYDLISRQGGWPRIPRRLYAGTKSKAVRILRRRLAMEGYLPRNAISSKRYDRQVAQAIFRFQRNMGLKPTGHVDRPTLKALNISAEARLETLLANLPRMEWAIKGVAPRYIIVNIPAAQLETVENGRVYSRHNVIVGMPDRPSPSLISRISELNFNPYWNAPLSIVIKDIIPKARKDPSFLKRMRIRVFDGYNGPEVDPESIDWDNIDPRRYHFRQDPGEGNAMASVKINFPNIYSVYLHDTPTPQLFTESARYFSSGCVRVEKVHILTEWILRDTPGWDRERIRQVVQSRERVDVKVVNPPSLIIGYFTAWVTGDGFAHFRDDIYRLDGTGFVHGQPKPVMDTARQG
ncbi:murein L,D-transpeptidase [Thermopetrobacter sp. TC1]|uniref:L,D-transpeptidase family protein n=1 Tax=Thermopetrobacter sp. TC1 TaxID=1495045 RepID=UPI00068D651F|nr:L,D-transpeptidase family protein [Thermopetrobacter sp. TC1]